MGYQLVNSVGNYWFLTHECTLIDTVMAPNQAVAAVFVQHLVPRGGEWEAVGPSEYRYRVSQGVDSQVNVGE